MRYIALVITKTVCDNIRELVNEFDGGSQAQAGRRCGLAQRVIGRVVNGEGIAMDTLYKVAQGYNLQPWQLLVPGLDPHNPPVIYQQTPQEAELYARLKSAAEAIAALKTKT